MQSFSFFLLSWEKYRIINNNDDDDDDDDDNNNNNNDNNNNNSNDAYISILPISPRGSRRAHYLP